MKLLREPLLHFMLIGAMIYMVFALFAEPEALQSDTTIVISAEEVRAIKLSWQKRWNRQPTGQELDGLIQEYIRESVLYRQALAMGLDKNDSVIRRRLAQKLRFLVEDLATLMEPDEQTLQAWFNENLQRFQEPPRYTFTQIFFNPDQRGETTLADAEKIKEALMMSGASLDLARLSQMGDGLMMQNYYPDRSILEIRKQFGSGFTESLLALPTGQWHGPVLSGYGVHLVYIDNIVPAATPEFASIREQVKEQWLDEQRETLNKQIYDQLLGNYDIVIEKTNALNKNRNGKSRQPDTQQGIGKSDQVISDNAVATLQGAIK